MTKRILFNFQENGQLFVIEDEYVINSVNAMSTEHFKKVNEFFRNSRYLTILLDQTLCLISNKPIDHYMTFRTDGLWIWSADINHYSKNYGIEIPEDFLQYILNKKSNKRISDEQLLQLTNEWFDKLNGLESDFYLSKRTTVLK